MRENAQFKSRRLLTQKRLTVRYVDDDTIRAVCRGDNDAYHVGYEGRNWYCTCPTHGNACSHILALKAICLEEKVEA